MNHPARAREEAPVALHERALENLEFIRDTMARSTRFTAVPGTGLLAMGLIALVTAWFASGQQDPALWLTLWVGAALLAASTSVPLVVRKARQSGDPLLIGAGRKFLLSLFPAGLAGAVLTWALFSAGQTHLLPPLWLLLYGMAVTAAGAFSVRVVPVMGLCFLAIGTVASLVPVGSGDLFMALGFGVVHLVCGSLIWRRYGG